MKIKFVIITTTLLSTLPAMQTIEESKIIYKQSIQEVLVSSTLPYKLLDEKNTYDDVLSNKSLNFEKAISNAYIVEIDFDLVSSKTHNNTEIYNINKLDEFMKNVKDKKVDKVRIVEYIHNDSRTWINKLYDLEYNGKKIKYIEYDTYSNPNAFIPSEPFYFDKLIIRDYPDVLWYGICSVSDKGDDCAPLISFNKSSIVK